MPRPTLEHFATVVASTAARRAAMMQHEAARPEASGIWGSVRRGAAWASGRFTSGCADGVDGRRSASARHCGEQEAGSGEQGASAKRYRSGAHHHSPPLAFEERGASWSVPADSNARSLLWTLTRSRQRPAKQQRRLRCGARPPASPIFPRCVHGEGMQQSNSNQGWRVEEALRDASLHLTVGGGARRAVPCRAVPCLGSRVPPSRGQWCWPNSSRYAFPTGMHVSRWRLVAVEHGW